VTTTCEDNLSRFLHLTRNVRPSRQTPRAVKSSGASLPNETPKTRLSRLQPNSHRTPGSPNFDDRDGLPPRFFFPTASQKVRNRDNNDPGVASAAVTVPDPLVRTFIRALNALISEKHKLHAHRFYNLQTDKTHQRWPAHPKVAEAAGQGRVYGNAEDASPGPAVISDRSGRRPGADRTQKLYL